MLQCTGSLVDERSCDYVVRRSNAALAALSAFLDVSSLNLAVLQGTAIFFSGGSADHIAQPTPARHEAGRRGITTMTGSRECSRSAWARSKVSEVSVLPPPVGTVSVKTHCGSAARGDGCAQHIIAQRVELAVSGALKPFFKGRPGSA